MFYARHLLFFPLLLLLTTGATSAPLPETGGLSGPSLSQAPTLEVRAGLSSEMKLLHYNALRSTYTTVSSKYNSIVDQLEELGYRQNSAHDMAANIANVDAANLPQVFQLLTEKGAAGAAVDHLRAEIQKFVNAGFGV